MWNKLFDVGDHKVRDHCHITRKQRVAAHWSFNINLKLSRKIPAIFHNIKGYGSHLIIKEISKFAVEVSVIPNGLEKYLVFIGSMQFMNSSLDSLIKNLSDNDFKYFFEECSGEFLELVKQKEYESIRMNIWTIFKRFLKINYLIDVNFLVL